MIQLKPQVGPKWYEFGVAAGIEKDVLDKFAEQCSPDDCIVEVIDYWLRKSTKLHTLSWRDVAKILKDIGLSELAHDMEGIYTTGNYYCGTFKLECMHAYPARLSYNMHTYWLLPSN